jgi:urea transporter
VAVYIVLGAIASTIVVMGLAKLLIGRDMAPLTAPFVVTAWLLLLFALYQFGQLRPTELIHPVLVHPCATIQTGLQAPAGDGGAVGFTVANLANALFRGDRSGGPPGQPLDRRGLRDCHPGQLADLCRLRVARLGARGHDRAGARCRRGRHLPRALWLQRGPDRDRPRRLFMVLEWQSTIYAFIGVISSAIVFAVIAVALSPIGMPALTAPSCSRPRCSCCRWPASEHWSGYRSPSAPRQSPWPDCAPQSRPARSRLRRLEAFGTRCHFGFGA